MLHKMAEFFKLFIEEDYSSLGLVGILLFLFGNIIWYLLDFYKLIKRKSQGENIAIMSFPVLVSVCGAALAMVYVHMPGLEHLEKFAVALYNQDLRFGLGTLVVIYAAIWLITYLSQQKRKREDVRNWIASCIPDYCFVAIILLGTVFPWFVKMDVVLWLYLYSLYLLACKIILLVIGNITRFYSLKITVIRWRKWKNPHAFLVRYFLLYQNAIARNVLLVLMGMLLFLTIVLSDAGWTGETANIMIYLYLGTLLPMALTAFPTKSGLTRLAMWGDRATMERLFCQEYFVEEHLYHDHNFTVTRHFLIEEQSPVIFYYLPNLIKVSGWIINETGRYKIISFSDGMQCRITPEEAEQSEQMFRYLQKYQMQYER